MIITTPTENPGVHELYFNAPTLDDVVVAVDGYLVACRQISAQWRGVSWRIDAGRKFLKVIRQDGTSASAFAFVNTITGDFFRAGSWKKPGSLAGNLLRGGRINHLPI